MYLCTHVMVQVHVLIMCSLFRFHEDCFVEGIGPVCAYEVSCHGDSICDITELFLVNRHPHQPTAPTPYTPY